MQQYCRCGARRRSPPLFFSRTPCRRPEVPRWVGKNYSREMAPTDTSRRTRAATWVRDLWQELRARRAGRQGMSTGIARATRDVTGPTGWVWSNAWQQLDDHGDAYMRSFDRRIPPSIFVSERDRTRHGQPMPLAERCLEDARPKDRMSADGAEPETTEVIRPGS